MKILVVLQIYWIAHNVAQHKNIKIIDERMSEGSEYLP